MGSAPIGKRCFACRRLPVAPEEPVLAHMIGEHLQPEHNLAAAYRAGGESFALQQQDLMISRMSRMLGNVDSAKRNHFARIEATVRRIVNTTLDRRRRNKNSHTV